MGQTFQEISGLKAQTQRDHSQLDKSTGLPLPELPLLAAVFHLNQEPTEMLDFTSNQPAIQTDLLLPEQRNSGAKKVTRKRSKRTATLYGAPELPLFGPEVPDQATFNANSGSPFSETNSERHVVQRGTTEAISAEIVALDPYTVTAAYLRTAIDGWTDWCVIKRRALHTAINHAETLLAQHRDKLAGCAPWSCGGLNRVLWPNGTRPVTLSNDAFRSTLTNLRTILSRLGLHADSRYGKNELSPAWKVLYDTLPTNERRAALVRFFRYLTVKSITPETVTPDALSDFYVWCDTQILHHDAAGLVRRSASNWENMRKSQQPYWPQVQLYWKGMRDHYALPFSSFPQSFVGDAHDFLNIGNGGTPSDAGNELLPENLYRSLAERKLTAKEASSEASSSARGKRRRRTQRTINTRLWQIQVATTALALSGVPIKQITSLSVLVTPLSNAVKILDFHTLRLRQRLRDKGEDFSDEDLRSSNLKGIGEVLRQIGKFNAGLSEGDMDELHDYIDMVTPHAQFGMTDKNYTRLKALFEDPTYSKLLGLPAHWIECANDPKIDPLDAARLAIYAAALEILSFLPLRRMNLLQIRLDGTLRRPAPNALINEIYIPANKVKNRQEIRWPVDPISARLLETYIKKFRPLLAKPGNDYLFPGIGDSHRDDAEFGDQLSKRVALKIGAEFNCHLVRHFAVVRYLRNNPGSYEIAASLLGHKNIETTRRFYCGLEIDEAARHANAQLMAERRSTKIVAQLAFREKRPIRRKEGAAK
jgi:integrase